MLEKKPNKKILVVKNRIFDIKSILKVIRSSINDQNFVYHEKEQTFKEDQYGRQITAKFSGSDEMDEFASAEISVNCTFSDVQTVKKGSKQLDLGNIEILIIPKVTYDYKNNWISSKIGEFFFNVWVDWFKDDDFKAKYMKPTQLRNDAIYQEIKKQLDYYQ